MNQWRRVRSPHVTQRIHMDSGMKKHTKAHNAMSSWPNGRGAGFLNRSMQVRALPGTLRQRPRGRSDRRSSSKRAEAGSTPAGDTSAGSARDTSADAQNNAS